MYFLFTDKQENVRGLKTIVPVAVNCAKHTLVIFIFRLLYCK